jgi:hypothetical protein
VRAASITALMMEAVQTSDILQECCVEHCTLDVPDFLGVSSTHLQVIDRVVSVLVWYSKGPVLDLNCCH